MPLEEALAMFLITLGHGFSNRMVQERFQHSGETVSRWFIIVLDVICHMAVDVIKPTDPQFKTTSDKIKQDTRYWSYFKDCIGAIDVDFNMCFTFVWTGWERAAHDARIFVEALRRPHLGFPHPPKGPYRGEHYHLADFRRGSHPRGMKEFKPYDDDEMLLPSIDEINYAEVNEEHRGSVREMEMHEERGRIAQLLMSS
ncbi:putative nuclease HARBI1 [Cucumis melo var. makuwa]|uniref:Nuclease HARBI1 n=1 Tax=Cucumis melo var. makuwa TaxID=1194695 RepID=A0A5D3BBN5_CUCMM|nr:putative nuclease HARBI1 [Cucumis melo var. makuwa]TYJ96723.1 putative nuclease HARBI1 [Cucumis melo var. makuwa]